MSLPDNVAYRLPAGTRIVADIHYRGASERVVDRGTLGVFFAKSPAGESATDLVIDARANRPAVAPSALRRGRPGGEASFNGRTPITADTTVWAIQPEIVAGLSSLEVSARRPDGGTDVLLALTEPFTRLADAVFAQDAEAARSGERAVGRRTFEDPSVRAGACAIEQLLKLSTFWM